MWLILIKSNLRKKETPPHPLRARFGVLILFVVLSGIPFPSFIQLHGFFLEKFCKMFSDISYHKLFFFFAGITWVGWYFMNWLELANGQKICLAGYTKRQYWLLFW
jgi:hypothetical protein